MGILHKPSLIFTSLYFLLFNDGINFANGLLPPSRTCEAVGQDNSTGLIHCGMDSFSAAFTNLPPYLHPRLQGPDGYEGTVYELLKSVINICCGAGVYLCMDYELSRAGQLEEEMREEHDVALPVAKTALTRIPDISGYLFLPVMETQGSLVVRLENYEKNVLRSSLSGTWPLAVLVLATAGIAGIFVWLLDRYWNPEEFPKSFVRGGWEGIWWAFVTMTTVGYGDRAPKSVPARILGLVWMFVGIVLMSIFTAALTAALSADTQKEFVVKGSKVGIINGTIEGIVGYRIGAQVTNYRNLVSLLEAVEDKTEDAALIDINLAMYGADQIGKSDNLVTDDMVYNSQ